MKTLSLYVVIIFAFLFITACKPGKKLTPLSPEKAMEIRNAIMAWMECEECEDSELNNVIKQGDIVIPTLGEILEAGPSSAKKEELAFHLSDTFDELMKYQANHPEAKVSMNKDEYVKTYMDNYVALYKSRAAIALGKFDSPDAKKALEKALKDSSLREDVVQSIKKALEK